MTNVDEFLNSLGNTAKPLPPSDDWSRVILPKSSYLILGDIGTGKSGLAYWLLEKFSQDYHLRPATVLPCGADLPDGYEVLSSPDDCAKMENAIVFIDEADLQLPMNNLKLRDVVLNFLMLPRQRNQIFLLAFHYPRLVMSTFLPSFAGFFLKRPPYLLEFAGKADSKVIRGMMEKAEERFAELVTPGWEPNPQTGELQHPAVLSHTYVVSPRLRWQGMLTNPLPSFWSDSLSCVWRGVEVESVKEICPRGIPLVKEEEDTLTRLEHVKELFPRQEVPYTRILEYDEHFTLEQLRDLARQKGLSVSGDKKNLAARIIASEESEA